MTHPTGRRRTTFPLIAAAALAFAGCNPSPPSPPASASPATTIPSQAAASDLPPAQVYAQIRSAVAAIRGLQPTAAVEPVTIDEAQLRTNLEAEFERENPPAELRDSEDLLIALGLLPAGASLKAITLDFQSGQVAGYYSPDRDQLFVVSRAGGLGAAQLVTYAHEFTHQLQDQHIGLESLGLDASDQSDRALGRLALVEGDATSVQTQWMLGNLEPEQLGELLGSALDPKALEALFRAPPFVRETALFPYEDGAGFVTQLFATGGYAAVDAAYESPPASTEQILHPELYTQRHEPVSVALPQGLAAALGAGWSEAGQDTLGELILGIWLTEGGVAVPDARGAAAGWGGDRLTLLRGPGGEVSVAVATEWDTLADAEEFAAAAATALSDFAAARHAISRPQASTRVVFAIGANAEQLVQAVQR